MVSKLVCVVCGALLLAFGLGPARAAEHALPKDPKTPAIVLDCRGGMIARQNDEPQFQILADGAVILGAPYGTTKRVEARISQDALRKLVQFIMDEQEFAKFDAEAVRKAIQAKGPGLAVADAGTTVIRVNVDDKAREAEVYALGIMATQHPDIKALAQLRAIEQRLRRQQNVLWARGPDNMRKHLATVNARLKADHPEVPPLIEEHVGAAFVRTDGTFWMQLSRTEELGEGQRRGTHASLSIPPDGEPEVKVQVFSLPPVRKPAGGIRLQPGP
jgi:hypothetical protein